MENTNSSMDLSNVVGCGCAACQSGQPDLVNYTQNDAQYQTQDDPVYAPSGPADPNTFANYLTHGFWQDIGGQNRSWAQDTVTYSISNEFTASQKAGITLAFNLWSDVADISFNEVASGADIAISEGDDGRAYSSSNTSGTTIVNNTISIDTNVPAWSDFNDLGDYALMTALHEIGHSLGLGHTGNYNGSADYADDAQWTDDTHQMTVMSYFNDQNVGSDHWNSSGAWQYSATPMLIDILAIQNIYGANYSTRSGDTVHGFNSNAGRAQYDFSVSDVPIAIWDGGGEDTLDLSGYSQTQTIYLTEGNFSSVGYMSNNMVIAFGTVIENAIGGSGIDTIYGNDAANSILGGTGNDIIHGSLGNDTLDGEGGNDTVVYSYSIDDMAFSILNAAALSVSHIGLDFTDMLSNFENYIFAGISYTHAQIEALASVDEFTTSFEWSGGKYFHNTTSAETTTLTAGDMGYNGASSATNLATVDRTGSGLTVTILNSNAPGVMKIIGADRADTLTVNGTHNDLTIRIYGGDGDDTITVSGVVGGDRIWGEGGADIIDGGAGADYIWGGTEGDILNGSAGIDKLYGEEGNDTLNGGDDRDFLYGNEGDDAINGDNGNDVMWGGDGVDTVYGGEGHDRVYGDAGDDFIYGENGNDRLFGGDDNDEIHGDAGGDFLYGDAGDDLIYGGNGSDQMRGGADNDIMYGEAHYDNMYGDDGNDIMHGGDHDDLVNGGAGNDRLNGDDGADNLYGESGMDTLVGGAGQDFLYGGVDADIDVFGFSASEDSEDRIYHFNYGTDQINITDLLTGYSHGSSDISDFVQIVHSGSRFDVRVDRDGGGDNYESVARVFTDISDGLTAQDLLDNGTLIANVTLV